MAVTLEVEMVRVDVIVEFNVRLTTDGFMESVSPRGAIVAVRFKLPEKSVLFRVMAELVDSPATTPFGLASLEDRVTFQMSMLRRTEWEIDPLVPIALMSYDPRDADPVLTVSTTFFVPPGVSLTVAELNVGAGPAGSMEVASVTFPLSQKLVNVTVKVADEPVGIDLDGGVAVMPKSTILILTMIDRVRSPLLPVIVTL